jgi:translation initiation factor IF-1
VLGLFLVAAVLLAAYTGLTAKDSSLHLKVQHSFHNAQVSVWVDGDLAYSGAIAGSTKKRFGILPTDSVQGTLSEIIPVRSGQHTVRVRISPDDATAQDDTP